MSVTSIGPLITNACMGKEKLKLDVPLYITVMHHRNERIHGMIRGGNDTEDWQKSALMIND